MKSELKPPKKGATQRLRDFYKKLRDETRGMIQDKGQKSPQTEKKIATPSNKFDLEM